jgi:hypothetical protein
MFVNQTSSLKWLSIVVAFMMALISLQLSYAEAAQPDDYTTSYYIKTSSTSDLYTLGYNLGQRDYNKSGTQTNAVILFFGAQQKNASGVWGASLWGTFQTNAQIATLASEFARGYYVGTSSDTASTTTIILSTNNSGSLITSEAGQQWANMVLTARSNASAYSSQSIIIGGNDMEIAWATAAKTKDWISGYDGVQGRAIYYDTGDAAGCPTSGTYSTSTQCISGNTWSIDDVHYKAYGAPPAWPLPQIYTTNGSQAAQWYRISLYGYDYKSGAVQVKGTLSQYQACQQTNSCGTSTNNTAAQAYNSLSTLLNGNTHTAQTMPFSTDVKHYPQW